MVVNLSDDVFVANTFISRFCGYMLRKEPHHKVIVITPCNSIHTFFMRFTIDVLFINSKYEVIKKIDGLSMNKIIMPVKDACYVLEAKQGNFKHIHVGDKVHI